MGKWKLTLAVGVVALGCMGCGAQGTENVESSEEISVSEGQEEAGQVQEEENGSEETDSGEVESEPTESQVEEKNDNYSDLEEKGESGEIAVFAEEIKSAVSNKDMEALADLCAYPIAVNDEVVENKDAFMQFAEDVIFTEERCAVIESVDVSALEETMAGVIMGDATPNIIFKSVDGKLGITAIN